MSMTWENRCTKCSRWFDSFSPSSICDDCWTDSDIKKRRECEDNIRKSDRELIIENDWKRRAEIAENKLSKLPKWLVKWL